MTLPSVKAKLLEGRKGLIVGIANNRSIAWGCARAFRALGAARLMTGQVLYIDGGYNIID